MTAVITHSVVSGAAANADVDVDGVAWDANHVITGVVSGSQGGTGVANSDSSTLTITGAFGTTFTVTATTSLTLPTTGTLATLAGSEAFTNKTYNGNTWTAGTGTLTIAAGKTLTASNTLTFTGTDASSVAFGTGGTVVYTASYGTGVATALAVNVGSAGSFVVNGGALGTPSSGTLTNATGLPVSTGISGFGTGIATALAINTGSAGAPVLFDGAGGTPSSLTLTNATGLPLSTGITGDLPFANIAQIATSRILGRTTAGTGDIESLTGTQATALLDNVVGDSGAGGTKGLVPAPAAGDAAAGKFLKADGNWTTPAGGGTVTNVASGEGLTGGPITGTGTLAISMSTASNVLGSDVNTNNTANYFDGPSMAQGTSGTWFVSGTVTVFDASNAGTFLAKLWDGTTVIASGAVNLSAAGKIASISLSGYLASPAANIRISVRESTHTTGSIQFNASGNSKDSFIFGIRIA